MTYNATDSVLRRHYDQHLSSGGAELAGTNEEGMRMAGVAATAGSAAASVGRATSANDSTTQDSRAGTHSRHTADHDTADTTTSKTSGGLGFLKILIPVAILGLLAWGAMKFSGKDAAVDTGATTGAVSGAVGDLGGQFGDFFGSTTETLSGITDADSATAALPKLEAAKGSLEGLTGMLSGADDSAKAAAASAVKDGMGSLGPVVDKLKGDSGIWGVLEPILAPMMEALKGMMG